MTWSLPNVRSTLSRADIRQAAGKFPARQPCHSFRPSGHPPPFPEGRRLHLIDFPIEKIIVARPRVDLAPTNHTAETARVLVGRMLLPCRGVRQPAIGTAKIFGRPYAACHPAIMRRTEYAFQPSALPRSTSCYSTPKICLVSDSVFLTPMFLDLSWSRCVSARLRASAS
jgi:hypothetical protein